MEEQTPQNNIWELYGVKQNPFSIQPLLVKGGILPLDSFTGRKKELDRLKKIFSSKGGSRVLVSGDVGVGKTTFVNFTRHYFNNKGYFTPFKEIAVQSEWDTTIFILNTLAAIYSTLNVSTKKPVEDETFKKLESYLEIGFAEADFSINIAGTGVGYGKKRVSPSNTSSFMLQNFFERIIGEIHQKTNNDVIIHYNNLELIEETTLRKSFDNLRDFFQTPNVHFVFVGNLSVGGIFQSIPRFSSTLTDTPITLENLKLDEVKDIIEKRFNGLKIDELDYIIPYYEDALRTLYNLYEGNIRDILNSLSTAVMEVTTEKPIILDEHLLSKTLKSVVQKRYMSQLTSRVVNVLMEAVKHPEITNRHLSKQTGVARSNISTYIGELQRHGCIYLRRKDGKDKYWRVDPKIRWLLLKDVAIQQRRLPDYR